MSVQALEVVLVRSMMVQGSETVPLRFARVSVLVAADSVTGLSLTTVPVMMKVSLELAPESVLLTTSSVLEQKMDQKPMKTQQVSVPVSLGPVMGCGISQVSAQL